MALGKKLKSNNRKISKSRVRIVIVVVLIIGSIIFLNNQYKAMPPSKSPEYVSYTPDPNITANRALRVQGNTDKKDEAHFGITYLPVKKFDKTINNNSEYSISFLNIKKEVVLTRKLSVMKYQTGGDALSEEKTIDSTELNSYVISTNIELPDQAIYLVVKHEDKEIYSTNIIVAILNDFMDQMVDKENSNIFQVKRESFDKLLNEMGQAFDQQDDKSIADAIHRFITAFSDQIAQNPPDPSNPGNKPLDIVNDYFKSIVEQ